VAAFEVRERGRAHAHAPVVARLTVDGVDGGDAGLVHVAEVLRVLEGVALLHVGVDLSARQQLVEDVVVALLGRLEADAALLQQVVDDGTAHDGAVTVELDLRPLTKAGGVVVAGGLGVTKRLHDGVGLEDLLLQRLRLLPRRRLLLRPARHVGQELQHQLHGLRLAGAALAGDDDGLVPEVRHQVAVRVVGDGVDVGRLGAAAAVLVLLHHLRRVAGQQLERVARHQDGRHVRVDVVLHEPLAQVVQDGGLVQVVQLDHVVVHLQRRLVHGQALLGLGRCQGGLLRSERQGDDGKLSCWNSATCSPPPLPPFLLHLRALTLPSSYLILPSSPLRKVRCTLPGRNISLGSGTHAQLLTANRREGRKAAMCRHMGVAAFASSRDPNNPCPGGVTATGSRAHVSQRTLDPCLPRSQRWEQCAQHPVAAP